MPDTLLDQLRNVGFSISFQQDGWFVSTPAGRWGPFTSESSALVYGIGELLRAYQTEKVSTDYLGASCLSCCWLR